MEEESCLRLAFICGPDTKFLTDLIRESGARHEVRTVLEADPKNDLGRIQNLLEWADVAWFEWCDRVLVEASNNLEPTCRILARLHKYEAFTADLIKIDWSFVDDLIFVVPHVRSLVVDRLKSSIEQTRTHVIRNGVDLDRFSFKEREPGFNLAFVGYLNYKKGPGLLIQCIRRLVEVDPRYTLHVAGNFQQPIVRFYLKTTVKKMGLEDHIAFSGWVDNVAAWLEDKHYLVSTSFHESFGYGIAEAMARGLKPIIHDFPGFAEIWPSEIGFLTVDEFVECIVEKDYVPRKYRRFIEENYSLELMMREVDELLQREITPAPTSVRNHFCE